MRGRLVRKTWKAEPGLDAPARYRRGCAYEAFIPEPVEELNPDLPGDLAGIVSEAENAIAALNATAGLELDPLARLLLRTESIASSKVEGIQIDARSLARAEANFETGRRVGADALEILGNIDAMQLAIEQASTGRIEPTGLIAIHKTLLTPASNSHQAGRVRTSQNWIGGNDYNPCGADFVPPPPEHVELLLDDLCRFANDETLPPLVHSAIAHAQFETIHPFDDGNGRTGRALVQVILRARGLAPRFVPPISVILARDKDRYIKGLTRFREGDMAGWLEVFSVAAGRAARLADRYLGKVASLQEQWRDHLRNSANPRSDAAAWAVIDVLPGHPVVTVAIGVAATRRTKPAVANAFNDLEEAGILAPLSKSARNRAWEATGLLDLIVDLEAGD